MLCFLVATTWVFFSGTDVTTKGLLGTILGLLILIASCVVLVESAAGAAPGTAKHRISRWILVDVAIRWRTSSRGIKKWKRYLYRPLASSASLA